jgi:hypothetical protein
MKNNIDGIVIKKRQKRKNVNQQVKVHNDAPQQPPSLQSRYSDTGISTRKKRIQYRGVLRIITPIIIALLVVFFTLNYFHSAEVVVTARKSYETIDRTISASNTSSTDNLRFGVVALTETVSINIETDTTEPYQEYARGTIRIFNDFSSSPQRLLPQTRFEAVDGSIFLSPNEEIIIPPKEGDTPGERVIQVVAQEPGPSYNIGPTDFSLPGFRELGLDDRYARIYAISTQAFEGGVDMQRPALSPERREEVTQEITQTLSEQLQSSLLQHTTSEMLTVQNSGYIEYQDPVYEFSEEQGVGTLTREGTIFALVVMKDELAAMLAESIYQEDTAGIRFRARQYPIVRYEGPLLDYEQLQDIQLTISGDTQFIWNPDIDDIKEYVTGLDRNEVRTVLDEFPHVGIISVKNIPHWKKNLPYDSEDITILLRN